MLTMSCRVPADRVASPNLPSEAAKRGRRNVENQTDQYQAAADDFDAGDRLSKQQVCAENPENRHQQAKRRNRRRRIAAQQLDPEPESAERCRVGQKHDRTSRRHTRMKKCGHYRCATFHKKRKDKQRQRRNRTTPDNEGERVAWTSRLRDDAAGSPGKS